MFKPGPYGPGFFYLIFNLFIMESLTQIVKGTHAKITHVCNGRVVYKIETHSHLYQLEIDSTDKEWESTYLNPEFKSITLMRWIRKGLETGDGSFIQLR
jgi:hypothetical protein